MSTTPIPMRLAGRPVSGGLVVPYVSTSDGTRHLLGNVHRSKVLRCITDNLCQACGEALTRPMVVFATDDGLAKTYSGEAALHPECAAYSAKACPMLAGQMDTYRSAAAPLDRLKCDEPGCGCAGWIPSPGVRTRPDGAPAEAWHAVWLPGYQIAIYDSGEVHGLSWRDLTPLRVRPVVPR